MYAVSDRSTEGRTFRALVIVGGFTRECLALVADKSLSGTRVARGIGSVIALRSRPLVCVSYVGRESTSMEILRWSQERRVGRHQIAPGKPQQNVFAESFTGCLRHECLNRAHSRH